MKWIARWPGQLLKPHDSQELIELLGSGALNVYDYVYDVSQKSWTRILEIEQIKDQIPSVIGFMPYPDAPEASVFSAPSFHPPTLLVQHALAPERNFSGDDFGATSVSTHHEVVDSDEIAFQKNLIEELQAQNEQLREQLAHNPLAGAREDMEREYKMQMDMLHESAREEVQMLQKELEFLKTEAMTTNEELQQYKQSSEEAKARVFELEQANATLNIELSKKSEKLEEYFKENEKIVAEFKKLAKNNKTIKDRLNDASARVDRERKNAALLKQNMLKLNEGLVLLKRKNERDRSVIQDLERYKKIHQAKEEQELNRLIGDSFEVDNSPMWWIRIGEEEKGPYSYADIRSFLKYKKVEMSSLSKKSGGEWQELGAHFEFKNDVISKEEMRDGVKTYRYFIKRTDFRAPFYDLAQLEIGAQNFKGYCTSISVGGCFIELSKIDKVRMEKGGKVLVKIKAGTLSEEISVRAIIRNISDKRPRGIGLQFENLSESQRDVIIEFVKQYVSSSSSKKAA